MLNLPGSPLAKFAIVLECERSPTDMTSAVSTIKDFLKTLGWVGGHLPVLLFLALGQSEQIVGPNAIGYGLEEARSMLILARKN